MKRLSMTRTLVDAQQSLRRFPLVLLCAVIAAIAAMDLIGHSGGDETVARILMAAVLGIPALLILALALENQGMPPWAGRLARLAGLLVPVLYYLFLPDVLPESQGIRFFVLLVAGHFLIAVAPFLRQNPGQALWQFNQILLLRLISSLLFTVVMFAGLSLALAALDNLLGVSLPAKIFGKLFMLLGFVFNTWFFLGGIPKFPLALADDDSFPRPLKVFAQHILSTLVVIYLAILLAYLAKVVLSGIWPQGWIGWLVSGVAVAGLLSLVLLSPLQGGQGNRWVRLYFLLFHFLMLPSVIMLVLAVGKRINQYGLTELRYLLLVLSGWLAVTLVLGLLTKRISIRFIPLSLGLLALVVSWGPWGTRSMSLHSQKGRLAHELQAVGLFSDGRLVSSQADSIAVNRSDISQSFKYLIDHFGFKELDGWLTPEMQIAIDNMPTERSNNWAKAELIVDELGNLRDSHPQDRFMLRHILPGDGHFNAVLVSSFEYALSLDLLPGSMTSFKWGDDQGEVALAEGGDKLTVKHEGVVLLEMPLGEMLLDLSRAGAVESIQNETSATAMTFDYANESLKVRLFIQSVAFKKGSELPAVQELRGLLLLGFVDPALVPGGE